MTLSIDTNSVYPCTNCAVKSARGFVRDVSEDGMSLVPEKTEEEKRLESSTISFQRQLSPEEEKRVQFLKNLMAQILTLADGQPTDEQRTRIKDIEKELEKITGVKMHSSISKATAKMPGKDNDKKKEELERQTRGIDPKEAVHSQIPTINTQAMNGGMQMLQRNGIAAYLKTMSLETLSDFTSIKA